MNGQIKIFIINLQRSVERRKEIIKKMDLFGLSYEFFNAVEGKDIPDDQMQKIHSKGNFYKKTYGRDMPRGEAGCALSHLSLYKKIVDENLSYAIILEDDIEFDQRLNHLANNKVKVETALKMYELILLGYCGVNMNYEIPGICSFWKRINLDHIIKIGTPVSWYWTTIGYIISYQGASKLLKQGDLPLMQADFLTANSPYYNVKLGIIRNQIIWPGKHSEVSLIENRIDTSLPAGSIQSRLDRKKNIIKNFIGYDQLYKVKKTYRSLWAGYMNVRQVIKIFFLKISTKPYQFVVRVNE